MIKKQLLLSLDMLAHPAVTASVATEVGKVTNELLLCTLDYVYSVQA